MKFLNLVFRKRPIGRLTGIFVTGAAGQPMQAVPSIEAIDGIGLKGDRYGEKTGFWKVTEACQVTLISTDDLRRAKRRSPAALHRLLDSGGHRRNLVVEGVQTRQLEFKTFRIGKAVFSYRKPRPPCGYLDQVEERGMCKALGRNSGICITVLRGGMLCVGDTLEIIEPVSPD